MRSRWFIGTVITAVGLAGAGACSSSGGNAGSTANDLCTPGPAGPTSSSGLALKPFCVPKEPGGAGITFAASGEVLALTGYDFPPAQPGDPAFVDGWEVRFSRLLVTVDKIKLSTNPDQVPTDQSKTGGVVAEVDGPWAIDLSHSDPSYLPGKGGPGEEAVPIAALSAQNKNGGASFATDGTRYAFGFDTIAATSSAQNVNIDQAGLDDYAEMIQNQCVVFYVGTATFKGDKTDPNCYPPQNQGWPDVVTFRLCFKSPTTYSNCQNPDNDPAQPFPNEEHQRGIAFLGNRSVVGQVTIHTDHPFWDSVLHDSPAHFDQFAARVITASGAGQGGQGDAGAGQGDGGMAADASSSDASLSDASVTPAGDGGVPLATLELTKGVDYTQYTDALGNALKWRYCVAPPTDVHPQLTGVMRFDAQNLPHASGGNPATGLRDYYDFSTYNQSTQGHLNSDGLCFVGRNYPSPP
jgi:hypothetical protein